MNVRPLTLSEPPAPPVVFPPDVRERHSTRAERLQRAREKRAAEAREANLRTLPDDLDARKRLRSERERRAPKIHALRQREARAAQAAGAGSQQLAGRLTALEEKLERLAAAVEKLAGKRAP